MLKFFWKNRGSVSIFLVLIMLPVMTAAALFVDAGKVSLGRSVVASSADLALSTALTGYDKQLKDMYGLFATVQDTDELFAKAEEFFLVSMLMVGVPGEDAESEAEQLVKMVKGEDGATIADILNIQLASPDDFSITKREDATLADAAILEKQIVEFMKYRAPMNTGMSFLSSLESFGSLKEQTKLVEKRTEYYTEQGELLNAAHAAWTFLAAYRLTAVGGRGGADYLKKVAEAFTEYEQKFSTVVDDESPEGATPGFTQRVIMDLYNAQDYDDFFASEMTLALSGDELTMMFEGLPVTPDIVVSLFGSSMDDFYTAKGWFETAISDYVELRKELFGEDGSGGAFGPSGQYYYGTDGEGAYKLQYLVQANRAGLYHNWQNAIMEVFDTYGAMEAARWAVNSEMDEAYNAFLAAEAARVEAEAEAAAGGGDGGDADADAGDTEPEEPELPYEQTDVDAMNTAFDDCKSRMESTLGLTAGASSDLNVNTLTKELEDNLAGAKAGIPEGATDTTATNNGLAALKNEVSGYRRAIDDAHGLLESAEEALNQILKDMEDLTTLQNEWMNLASTGNVANTDMGKNDAAEAEGQAEVYNSEEVTELRDRVTAIKGKLAEMLTAIDSHTFFGKKITEIGSYETLKKLLEDNITDSNLPAGEKVLEHVPITEAYLIQFVKDSVEGKYQGNAVEAAWVDESGTKVSLDVDEGLEFYKELRAKFDNLVKNEEEMQVEDFEAANESVMKEAEEKAEEEVSEPPKGKVEGLVNSANEEHDIRELGKKDGVELPSEIPNIEPEDTGGDDEDGSIVGNAASQMPDFGTHLANFGSDIIEKLYVADYILSMFSYDTIEAEHKVKNKGADDVELYTLTREPINAENNFAYAREVEYIIYGGGNGGNVAAAYASIFGIRLAFNLIYAFSSPEVRNSALAIATPISAATLGVVPVPLIQAVVIVGLACCESGIDLIEMKAGKKVQLFKDKSTWVSSVGGLINKAKDTATDLINDAVSAGVDYVSNQLGNVLDMSADELKGAIDGTNEAAQQSLNGAITDIYDRYITQTVDRVATTITTAITNEVERIRMGLAMSVETAKNNAESIANQHVDAVIGVVKQSLEELKASYSTAAGTDPDEAELVAAAVDAVSSLLDSAGDGLKDEIMGLIVEAFAPTDTVDSLLVGVEEKAVAVKGKVMEFTNGIRDTINGKVNEFTNKLAEGGKNWIENKKDDFKKMLNTELEKGGDKVKTLLTDKANGAIASLESSLPDDVLGAGGSGTKDKSSGIAALFSFGYSDYLRLFLIIGLYTGEENILVRTADVIQANMMMKNETTEYKLSESGVYLELDVKVMVKPTLLALPLFARLEYNKVEDANWYTVSYSDIRGY